MDGQGDVCGRGSPRVGAGRKLAWDAEGAARVADMLVAMLGQKAPDITSPDELARRMAALAHMIREVALDTLRSRSGKPEGEERARGA